MPKARSDPRHYAFAGRNFERADLRGKDFRGVNFTCANLRAADLSGSDLRGAVLVNADLSRACLAGCDARGADFSSADLTGAYLRAVDFSDARLWHTSLKGALCKNTRFFRTDLTGADIARAEMLGARFDEAVVDGLRNVKHALFRWFMPPGGGKPIYDPWPGAVALTESITGAHSYQENAGMGQTGRDYLPPAAETEPEA